MTSLHLNPTRDNPYSSPIDGGRLGNIPNQRPPRPGFSPLLLLIIFAAVCVMAVEVLGSEPDAQARLDALKKPKATWTQTSAQTTQQDAPDTLYMVTESYCGPCKELKKTLAAEGIEYTPLSIAEFRSRFNLTVSSIPYLMSVRANGQKNGSYGRISSKKLQSFTSALRLASTTTSSAGRTTCHIPGKRSPEGILNALLTHIAVQSGGDLPLGGLTDIHIPLSTKISDILVLISHKQQIDIGRFVTMSWQDLSITSSAGRTKFLSPVTIEGRALGISLSASLKEIYLHEDGRTLDVVIQGFPDLRVVFD